MQGSSGNKEQSHWTGSFREKTANWANTDQLGNCHPDKANTTHTVCATSTASVNTNNDKKWAVKSKDDKQIRVVKTNKQWQKIRNDNAVEKQTSHQLPRHKDSITDLNKNKNKNHPMIIHRINNNKTWLFLSLITLIVASIKFRKSKQRENLELKYVFLHIL